LTDYTSNFREFDRETEFLFCRRSARLQGGIGFSPAATTAKSTWQHRRLDIQLD
jgi:hypothetical protein